MEADAFTSQDTISLAVGSLINLDDPPASDVYDCDSGPPSARCGTLFTRFPLTIAGAGGIAVPVAGNFTVIEATGDLTLDHVDLIGGGSGSNVGPVVRATLPTIDTELTITDSRMIGGSSTGDGGALELTGSGTATLTGVALQGSSAAGSGGGVHVGDQAGLFATGLSVVDNQASRGGGIAVDTTGPVNISQSAILRNSATIAGGGVWCDCTDLQFSQATIARNRRARRGRHRHRPRAQRGLRRAPVPQRQRGRQHHCQWFGGVHRRLRDGWADRHDLLLLHDRRQRDDDPRPHRRLHVQTNTGDKKVTLENSVISGNIAASDPPSDCGGDVVTAGVDFVTASQCVVGSGPALRADDPQLQPITDVAVRTAARCSISAPCRSCRPRPLRR